MEGPNKPEDYLYWMIANITPSIREAWRKDLQQAVDEIVSELTNLRQENARLKKEKEERVKHMIELERLSNPLR